MEIRDVLHGAIEIETRELPVIDSRVFQRLRLIKQLGFAENSFPGATHNRYIHSLGAMQTASQAFFSIFGHSSSRESSLRAELSTLRVGTPDDYSRFRAVTRFAALLHDVGHGPLSHTSEFAMPMVDRLSVPGLSAEPARQATHEDYTLKIILDSSLTAHLEKAGAPFGFGPTHVAALIEPSVIVDDDFFNLALSGQKLNLRPILQQLISSELDADRMDYLRRDSLHCGVSYGQFDYDWLLRSLTHHTVDNDVYLGLEHRALYSFEDFLISRYHMFLMVYFHYKSVVFDSMLGEYFASPDCDYEIPAGIDDYINFTDDHLSTHLARSENVWAKRITEKRAYRLLIELHSDVPSTPKANLRQQRLLKELEETLKQQGTHFIEATSTGELSKYFRRPGDPIYVRYDNHYSEPEFIPLERCTDLFKRYEEKRSITRLYVSPEDYTTLRAAGRVEALNFEDENHPLDRVGPTGRSLLPTV